MTARPHSEHLAANGPCDKYDLMRPEGVGAAPVYAAMRSDGADQIAAIRMLRQVYGLTLTEAKKVCVEVDTGRSIEHFQHGLVQEILKVLDDIPKK
ncbi:hypothetical protein F2P45_28075 [Massilia sp. CCM 8733]|uniref:Uncharacterized protein n=1 Tax=Massilia mucilaginosa TaxID=2609282 RepID=A0ABX0P165_9BURK|nr:hypothetical protein [Massilia mucilaginosa]NHZ92837.1 hypothetical protein [Massilia mucilaginosa]